MADDLDDNWLDKDDQIIASDSDEDGSDEEPPTKQIKTKDDTECTSVSATVKSKKKKKDGRKRKKITEELKNKGSEQGTVEDVTQMIKAHYKDKLSPVEWDEIEINPGIFHTCAAADDTPVSYMKMLLPKWKKMLSTDLKPGTPMVLVVSSSAIRCVQLNRDIAQFKQEKCKTAKLFAKHFKLTEQQKYLSKHVCHLGIGTPNRMISLLKAGCLHLEKVSCVVLDWNWRDVKQKRIIDIPDIKNDMMTLLKDFIIPHVKQEKCKIGLF